MSNIEYISDAKNILNNFFNETKMQAMIEIQIDALLEERGRSFYWLAKQAGISHTTLWRLKKGKALGINFITLEKICQTLGCEPGDLLRLGGTEQKGKPPKSKTKADPSNIRQSMQ